MLRYYVSISEPTKNLKLVAKFKKKVYFPSWFDIKINKYLTDDPKIYLMWFKLFLIQYIS